MHYVISVIHCRSINLDCTATEANYFACCLLALTKNSHVQTDFPDYNFSQRFVIILFTDVVMRPVRFVRLYHKMIKVRLSFRCCVRLCTGSHNCGRIECDDVFWSGLYPRQTDTVRAGRADQDQWRILRPLRHCQRVGSTKWTWSDTLVLSLMPLPRYSQNLLMIKLLYTASTITSVFVVALRRLWRIEVSPGPKGWYRKSYS